MQWFHYTVTAEGMSASGLIQADTVSEAADLVEAHYKFPDAVISVLPWKEPGV